MPSVPGQAMKISIEEYRGPLMVGAHQSTITTSEGVMFADVAIKETPQGQVQFYRISGDQNTIDNQIKALLGKRIESDDINLLTGLVDRRIADLQGGIGLLQKDIAQQLSDEDIRALTPPQQEVARQVKSALQQQNTFLTTQLQSLQGMKQKAYSALGGGARRMVQRRRVPKHRVSRRRVLKHRASKHRVTRRR